MANGNGLRLIGWAYGGLAATVALVAFLVVSTQINARVEARADTRFEGRAGIDPQFAQAPN